MIGIKLLVMTNDFGLTDIDIRVNDKASFYYHEPDRKKLLKDRAEWQERRFNNPAYYKTPGLTYPKRNAMWKASS